jgi:hypothetical protein
MDVLELSFAILLYLRLRIKITYQQKIWLDFLAILPMIYPVQFVLF